MKIYSVETKNENVIDFSRYKIVAILKCLFVKKAFCVFEFTDKELVGCVFSKGGTHDD